MNEIAYAAFFDELAQIEKRAMLKQAAFLGSVAQGFKNLAGTAPKNIVGQLKGAWKGGVDSAKAVGPIRPRDAAAGGLRGLAANDTARALGVGALGVGALGAGTLGAGYLAGRSSAAPR